ncbi:hypothetical protein [Streptomyces sp. TM32]|uniref:hypothetical protein n=1 Tax=Streptomyces sp. TM32 TaxID=1652669 RepID=UPI0020B14AE3|nr:hypothetical protein [Streptomyces sp. TM32]
MSTVRDSVLTRGARGAGAVICLLLALLAAGWIIRDLVVAGHPADVWWAWLGETRRPREFTAWATSALDPLLLLGALAAAVAQVRTAVASSVAVGALLSLAAAVALLRIPLVWVLGADWLQGLDGGLTAWARITVLAQLALAAALFVVVATGRRRPPGRPGRHTAGAPAPVYGVVRAVPSVGGPGRPGSPYRGPAVTAGVLLGAAGLTLAGWEIHWRQQLGWYLYRKGLLGDASVFRALLQPPVHWQGAALAVLALGAAAAALRRAAAGRPAALTAAALLLTHAAVALVHTARAGEFGRLAALPAHTQLEAGTAVFVAAAALVVLLAAARPGLPDTSRDLDAVRAYGMAPDEERPPHAPPPPSTLPPGW